MPLAAWRSVSFIPNALTISRHSFWSAQCPMKRCRTLSYLGCMAWIDTSSVFPISLYAPRQPGPVKCESSHTRAFIVQVSR
jgi:hypothetical protein